MIDKNVDDITSNISQNPVKNSESTSENIHKYGNEATLQSSYKDLQENNLSLPQLIILYGPPGCGKGTQASLLSQKLGYEFLDWGHSFREFAAQFKDSQDLTQKKIAQRVNQSLVTGEAILTEDLLFIIGKKITDLIQSGKKVIMDKPGSLPPEATWISQLIKQKNISTIFIHLPVDIEESLTRVLHRYYVPGQSFPYPSKEEAAKNCPAGVEPVMRKEDQDAEITKTRYFNLYQKHRDEILKIYQQEQHSKMVEINAKGSIDKIHKIILNTLYFV